MINKLSFSKVFSIAFVAIVCFCFMAFTYVNAEEDSHSPGEDIELSGNIKESPFEQKYWVIFNEGYRNGRIEASSFDSTLSADELYIVWDYSLELNDTSTSSECSQYYRDQNGEWVYSGNYSILTDYAINVIASNLDVRDSSGAIIKPSMAYSDIDWADTDNIIASTLDSGDSSDTETESNNTYSDNNQAKMENERAPRKKAPKMFTIVLVIVGIMYFGSMLFDKKIIGYYETADVFGRVSAFLALFFTIGTVLPLVGPIVYGDKFDKSGIIFASISFCILLFLYIRVIILSPSFMKGRCVFDLFICSLATGARLSLIVAFGVVLILLSVDIAPWFDSDVLEVKYLPDGRKLYIYPYGYALDVENRRYIKYNPITGTEEQ